MLRKIYLFLLKLFKKIFEMAKQVIGIGSSYDDPTADPIRDGFDKCNDNFTELYTGLDTTNSNVSTITGRIGTATTVEISIGTWNMDTDASKSVAWTLPANRSIRTIQAIIYPDGSTSTAYPIYYDGGSGLSGSIYYNGTNIILTRTELGFFDDAAFDATTARRGWITITYDVIEPA